MQGNWDGYTDEDMICAPARRAEHLIEHSELSTSISNIVRAGWPRKTFNSRNFTLRDSDILHGGIGACGQTFGLLGFWGAQEAKGDHSNYTFENLFLDNWYSLAQMEQEYPGLHGFTFRNIWALDQPPLADSTMTGDVADVTFDNVKYGQRRAAGNADLPLTISGGAAPANFTAPHGPVAAFTVDPPVFAPGQPVTFSAQPSPGAQLHLALWRWNQASGRRVRHRFPDADGTELDGAGDGAGRFRVLLHVRMMRTTLIRPVRIGPRRAWWPWLTGTRRRAFSGPTARLAWRIYPGEWTELPDLATKRAVFTGESPNLHADAQGFTRYAAHGTASSTFPPTAAIPST
jgi:hypothetical protein